MKHSRRRERRHDDDEYGDRAEQRLRQAAPHSPALTAVAVLNFLVGGFMLLVGTCGCLSALMMFNRDRGMPVVAALIDDPVFFAAMVGGLFLWGLGTISAGVGVAKRRVWGRYLTLFLSAWGLVGAAILAWGIIEVMRHPAEHDELTVLGCVIFGLPLFVQGAAALAVLLQPRFGQEFL